MVDRFVEHPRACYLFSFTSNSNPMEYLSLAGVDSVLQVNSRSSCFIILIKSPDQVEENYNKTSSSARIKCQDQIIKEYNCNPTMSTAVLAGSTGLVVRPNPYVSSLNQRSSKSHRRALTSSPPSSGTHPSPSSSPTPANPSPPPLPNLSPSKTPTPSPGPLRSPPPQRQTSSSALSARPAPPQAASQTNAKSTSS